MFSHGLICLLRTSWEVLTLSTPVDVKIWLPNLRFVGGLMGPQLQLLNVIRSCMCSACTKTGLCCCQGKNELGNYMAISSHSTLQGVWETPFLSWALSLTWLIMTLVEAKAEQDPILNKGCKIALNSPHPAMGCWWISRQAQQHGGNSSNMTACA